MITLTDHEQAATLTCARYSLQGLRATLAAIQAQGDKAKEKDAMANIVTVERLIDVLENRGPPNGGVAMQVSSVAAAIDQRLREVWRGATDRKHR